MILIHGKNGQKMLAEFELEYFIEVNLAMDLANCKSTYRTNQKSLARYKVN